MAFRVQRHPSDGVATMGDLFQGPTHLCATLEPANPIPAGTYPLTIEWSQKRARLVPWVNNVPGHTAIEIHWGNWAKDTKDCLLVGEYAGRDFVGHSVAEFNDLFKIIQDALVESDQTITYLDAVVPDPTFPTDSSGTVGGSNQTS